MKKVKALKCVGVNNAMYDIDDIFELDDEKADYLVRQGIVVIIDDEKKEEIRTAQIDTKKIKNAEVKKAKKK